jgi:hypothetical protein
MAMKRRIWKDLKFNNEGDTDNFAAALRATGVEPRHVIEDGRYEITTNMPWTAIYAARRFSGISWLDYTSGPIKDYGDEI